MSARQEITNVQPVVFAVNKLIHFALTPVNKSQSVIEPVAL